MAFHHRLVTVTVGVTVKFETKDAIDDRQAAGIAQVLAADVVSKRGFELVHPPGVAEDIDDVTVLDTEVGYDLNEVEDEGDWS